MCPGSVSYNGKLVVSVPAWLNKYIIEDRDQQQPCDQTNKGLIKSFLIRSEPIYFSVKRNACSPFKQVSCSANCKLILTADNTRSHKEIS